MMHFEDIGRVAEEMWSVYRKNVGGPEWAQVEPSLRVLFRAMAWRAIRKLRDMHYIDELLVNVQDEG